MLLREVFTTTVNKRIEPVVKVIDRTPEVIHGELSSLVVTPQWERYLRSVLDSYAEAADRDDEQSIGIWVSGFFGSGKSLLVKVLGALLENSDLHGQTMQDVFLSRLPATSADRATIERLLTIIRRKLTTTVVGGNLHAMQANRDDSLALIVFRLFAEQRNFTKNWPFAWAIEYQIDERGKTADFRERVEDRTGELWNEIVRDPEFYLEHLYAAAAEVLPNNFSNAAAVERAVNLTQQNGITPVSLIDRLRQWCVVRDGGGKRHKLLLQLDELGQWIAGGPRTERAQQVQALIETAATNGRGRIWIAVTAHGDVQELRSSLQQEEYAKINQRFANKCKLSNEDISRVVEQRLLQKTQPARVELERRFGERSGDLADKGTVNGARVYPVPNAERFALFYPYMPWTVTIIPDVVKGIAQAAGRDEALTGSNRTMIGVVQGAMIETAGLLDQTIGRMLCLADLYDQLASDAPIETKTDLNKIRESVHGATDFTPRVAKAVYLLGEGDHIPTTLEHITRALVDSVDTDLSALRARVKTELDRLVDGRFVKQVGEQYIFLNTQQRTFQDRVRARQEEIQHQTYDLSLALKEKEYESYDALRFERVPIYGRELPLKLEIDGRVVRNPTAHVTIRVFSPFQRSIDPHISNDVAMKQRSNEHSDTILVRLDDVTGLRAALALAMATDEVAKEVTSSTTASDPEKEVARTARQDDLPQYKRKVQQLLDQAVRGATIFFRGTTYHLLAGDSPSAAVRATLSDLLPQVYARFADLPHRVANEEAAVKAALAHNTSNSDLRELGVYRADGTLNDANPLIDALRSRLPTDDTFQGFVQADELRTTIEQPPFGWDPHVTKIGLALLLRESRCRLIDGGRTLANPADPEVTLVLTREARFKTLRVQGVKSDLLPEELREIRGYMEALFGVKPSLVPEMMHTALGEQLSQLVHKAQDIQTWANTARCPLPIEFDSGLSLANELLNTNATTLRLGRFREQAETLTRFTDVVQMLADFKRDQGAEFGNLREFFTSMVYADVGLTEVDRFIADWRAVTEEKSVTQPARWNEVLQVYHAARQAMTNQVATWRRDATADLSEIEGGLDQQVRAAGVPDEQVASAVAVLRPIFQPIHDRLGQTTLSYNEARSILTNLTNANFTLQQRVRELRQQYVPPPPTPEPSNGVEVRLRWSEVVGHHRITSETELDDVLERLRNRLLNELDQQKTIVLE